METIFNTIKADLPLQIDVCLKDDGKHQLKLQSRTKRFLLTSLSLLELFLESLTQISLQLYREKNGNFIVEFFAHGSHSWLIELSNDQSGFKLELSQVRDPWDTIIKRKFVFTGSLSDYMLSLMRLHTDLPPKPWPLERRFRR